MKQFATITVLLALLVAFAGSANADTYQRVSDKGAFLSLMNNKTLSNRLYGVTLAVQTDGRTVGKAVGWDLTGTWEWVDGYFCRQMDWGGTPIDFNCQLVEARGDEVRFVVDRGAGDSAAFRLR